MVLDLRIGMVETTGAAVVVTRATRTVRMAGRDIPVRATAAVTARQAAAVVMLRAAAAAVPVPLARLLLLVLAVLVAMGLPVR